MTMGKRKRQANKPEGFSFTKPPVKKPDEKAEAKIKARDQEIYGDLMNSLHKKSNKEE